LQISTQANCQVACSSRFRIPGRAFRRKARSTTVSLAPGTYKLAITTATAVYAFISADRLKVFATSELADECDVANLFAGVDINQDRIHAGSSVTK
jgi:hypothetical protein